ncbi:hypothetical protein CPB83DRAFT_894115 [Crepidotus variabilis]|uniref:Uncharacterized protein n=1 Tax=Crepidotus variabilis TaxID=179855 RepID=A0A9P6EGC2_9AGAR|nr:hypothetical protein CPB83DRAFT_894115 [Crepidotus variabilis]
MLAASRAFWRHVTRSETITLNRIHPLPPSSSRTFTSAFLTRRHTNSPTGHLKARRNAPDDFPIDVLNAQAAFKDLVRSMEQGSSAESAQLLSNLLASLPANDESRVSTFHQLKTVLTKNPKENLALLAQLGLGFTSLGFGRLVREEILPVVQAFGSQDDMMSLQLELDRDVQGPGSTSIFEDGSIVTEPITESQSTHIPIDLVVALDEVTNAASSEDLEAHYPEPAPPVEDLAEVFEDEDGDYAQFEPSPSKTVHSSRQSAGMLVNLVEQELYERAYVLLQEMQDLDAKIPYSFIYEKAALAALQRANTKPEEKLVMFTAWFSLVPLEINAPSEPPFGETTRLLIQSPLLQLSILLQFGLIAARKGYAERISDLLFPPIVRATSPEVLRKFVEDFLHADHAYLTNHMHHVKREARMRLKKSVSNVRGIVIRILTYSGRLDEAVAFLPDPDNPQFKLSVYTYNLLLKRLWVGHKDGREKQIQLVERLRGMGETAIRQPIPSMLQEVRIKELSDELNHGFTTANPVDFDGDVLATLRYLKNHVAARRRSEVAHPFTLVNFMSMYLATGRTRALELLLNKAIRTSFFATSNFVYAEMLFYRRLQQPQLVLKTFVDHLFISGVPRDEVITRYYRLSSMYELYDPTSGEAPPLRRFYPFDYHRSLPRGKMWPRRVHTNLVWDCLAQLNTEDHSLKSLYKQLVFFTQHGHDAPTSVEVSEADEVPIPQNWQVPVGAAAFTPFIQRLMYINGPGFGARILRDMLRLGQRPTEYHYTELVGFYARRGDIERTMLVLNAMEARVTVSDPTIGDNPAHTGVAPPIRNHNLPAPTLVTYTAILRGFLIAKHLEGAEETYRRIQKLEEYNPGSSPELDLAVDDLMDFRSAGAAWVYPYARKQHKYT